MKSAVDMTNPGLDKASLELANNAVVRRICIVDQLFASVSIVISSFLICFILDFFFQDIRFFTYVSKVLLSFVMCC